MNLAIDLAVVSERGALIAVADALLGERLARAFSALSDDCRVTLASNLPELRLLASQNSPEAILIDGDLVESDPLPDALRPFVAFAPVIFLGPLQRRAEAAPMVAEGDVEFVARAGDFVSLAVALLARRIRWARMSESLLGPPWAVVNGDLGTIFRHEINNPLTGILGNAELVLGHSKRLGATDAQRLQTVVDLAVRLRETIRRLSNALERGPGSLTHA
ncbi:MAG: hypothetical protein KGL02_05000 [Acidobacteriota bacterium]|nr:hypothetical protein [Acidobacteriota bacterium]